MHLKRKLKMYTMQIQQETIGLVRKKIFFDFFDFRINARGPPKIFNVQFFKILKKKIQKMTLLGPGKC